MQAIFPPDVPIISVSKGLEVGSGKMMSEVIPSALGRKQPAAFLSGPSFAKEIMDLRPTGVVAAAKVRAPDQAPASPPGLSPILSFPYYSHNTLALAWQTQALPPAATTQPTCPFCRMHDPKNACCVGARRTRSWRGRCRRCLRAPTCA